MQKKILAVQVMLALSIAVAVPAMAQLEEVVVTAQKREQSANDIGMAISALSGDTLKELNILDTADLAIAIPGLTYANSGLSVPIYTLRGVGFNEDSVQAQATVGVYNDQVGVPYPIMTKGLMMDIERVEVMKGPQGTLFGRNSTGGAINYIANKPTDEFEASVTGGYGRFETSDISGYVSGPLTDTISARLAVRTVQSQEGWQESVTRNDDLGEEDKTAARLLVNFEASDTLDVLLAAGWWQDKSDTQAPQYLSPNPQGLGGDPNANPITNALQFSGDYARVALQDSDDNRDADWTGGNYRGGKPENDMESYTFSATVNWELNDAVTLTSLSSYSKFDNNDTLNNLDGYGGMPLDNSVSGITAQDTITPLVRDEYDGFDTIGLSSFSNDASIKGWSQELRFSGDIDEVSWILGGYLSHDKVDSTLTQYADLTSNTNLGYVSSLNNVGIQSFDMPGEQKSDTWAIFGHSEWAFADAWKLTLGLRYTDDKKDFEGCSKDNGDGATSQYINTLVDGDTVPGGCITFLPDSNVGGLIKKSLDEDSTSGRVGLDWNVTDEVLTYASYSRGYKSGSFPTTAAFTADQLDPVTQEKVDAYELGVKADFADGLAHVNAAIFYYDYSDKQLISRVSTVLGALPALQNVPESEVSGAEIDLQWAPIDGLMISLAGSYTDTEVKKFSGYNNLGVRGVMDGSDFPLTPEYQATAMVQYDWSVGTNLMAFVGADVSYSDGFNTDYAIKSVTTEGNNPVQLQALGLQPGDSIGVLPNYELDDYTLVGARFGIYSADQTWRATVWGRNITDEYYRVSSRKMSDADIAYTGKPATYGITLTYNWM